jgi:hypothetical protein
MSRVAIALVHYPVVDRQGEVITTAITNLDLHDMARTAKTYGLSDLFIVHPIAAQRELAERIRAHWVGGSGAKRIPTREAAMDLVRVVERLEDVYEDLGGRERIAVYSTAARSTDSHLVSFAEGRRRIQASDIPVLILFGTGWGLAASVLDSCDRLAPIEGVGQGGYNHLSVRAACAIALDRLLGPRSFE